MGIVDGRLLGGTGRTLEIVFTRDISAKSAILWSIAEMCLPIEETYLA
jgi:hypothetical protein